MDMSPGLTLTGEEYSKIILEVGATAICQLTSLVNCRVFLTPFLVAGAVGCLSEQPLVWVQAAQQADYTRIRTRSDGNYHIPRSVRRLYHK